jgi:hypothetical protein
MINNCIMKPRRVLGFLWVRRGCMLEAVNLNIERGCSVDSKLCPKSILIRKGNFHAMLWRRSTSPARVEKGAETKVEGKTHGW